MCNIAHTRLPLFYTLVLVPTIDAPEMRLSQQAECLRLGDESEDLMVAPFDVFTLKNGESKWVSCADTITQAIESLRKKGCGLYFIFS